jgi:hypothetical protein
MNEVVAKAIAAGAQARKNVYANVAEPQKKQLVEYYRTMGWSNQQIADYTGITVADVQPGTEKSPTLPETVPVSELDAIYAASDLTKPGVYEVVFRTPPSNQLFHSGDNEIRFPVSFAQFR